MAIMKKQAENSCLFFHWFLFCLNCFYDDLNFDLKNFGGFFNHKGTALF